MEIIENDKSGWDGDIINVWELLSGIPLQQMGSVMENQPVLFKLLPATLVEFDITKSQRPIRPS